MGREISSFLSEINEQPNSLRDLIEHYQSDGMRDLDAWAEVALSARRVVFTGMGTSEFAPEMVLMQLAQQSVDASTIDAGELLHYKRPIAGALVLLSQSGESVETRKVAEEIFSSGAKIAITNNEESTVARAAALHIHLCSGHETAISTKSYVNQLAVLHLMAKALQGPDAVKNGLRCLAGIADSMSSVRVQAIERAAELLCDGHAVHFIARGSAITAARQAALTFMEGTRMSATPFTGGAFRHGPFELVDSSHRCVLFASGGEGCRLLTSMAAEIAEKGSHIVVITDQEIELDSENSCVLRVPAFGEELFALSAATTQALLLHHVAARRGVCAGEFRYGAKVTERE